MVLSRREICEYIKSESLRFDPPVDDVSIEQVSVDLRLGRRFTTFKKAAKHIGALQIDASLWEADLWDEAEADYFLLDPRAFVLAQTLERVLIPNDLVGFVDGRSSWARIGVSVHVTAPKIDPGFSGHITLEMTNLSPYTIKLRPGEDKPAQLVLMKLSSPIPEEEIYGTKKTHTFQGQVSPIPRR